MQNPKEPIKAYIKKILSDVHATIVGIILVGLGISAISLFVFFENVWSVLKTTMLQPMPVWAVLVLVLLVLVYVYLKLHKHPLANPKPVNWLFVETGKYKWKVHTINGYFHTVERIPYCTKHDLQLISSNGENLFCPSLGEDCNIKMRTIDIPSYVDIATSLGEKEARRKC